MLLAERVGTLQRPRLPKVNSLKPPPRATSQICGSYELRRTCADRQPHNPGLPDARVRVPQCTNTVIRITELSSNSNRATLTQLNPDGYRDLGIPMQSVFESRSDRIFTSCLQHRRKGEGRHAGRRMGRTTRQQAAAGTMCSTAVYCGLLRHGIIRCLTVGNPGSMGTSTISKQ